MFIPEISCLSGKFMNTKLVCNFQNTVAEMLRTRITTKGQQGLLRCHPWGRTARERVNLKPSRHGPFLGCPVRGEACIHFHLHQEPCSLSAESVYRFGYLWQCAGHPSRVRRHGSHESPLRHQTTIPLRDVSEL